jgi:hypothetical protein
MEHPKSNTYLKINFYQFLVGSKMIDAEFDRNDNNSIPHNCDWDMVETT